MHQTQFSEKIPRGGFSQIQSQMFETLGSHSRYEHVEWITSEKILESETFELCHFEVFQYVLAP